MEKSPEIKELAIALAAFQSEVKGARQSGNNTFFNSTYSDLEDVWMAARDAKLAEVHGLSVLQLPAAVYNDGEALPGLTTMLMHISGQWISETMPLMLAKGDPQGQGSAITYARRYAFCGALGIFQHDDDAEKAQENVRRQVPNGAPASASTSITGAPKQALRICPKCGEANIRKSKKTEGEIYCWINTNGCGYVGTEADYHITSDEIPF
jgi:predicted RNA-binding Zn-ribbon protein involved in translation (DUF1610 family)